MIAYFRKNLLYEQIGSMAHPTALVGQKPCRIPHKDGKRSPNRHPQCHANQASSHHPILGLAVASTISFLPQYGDSSRSHQTQASKEATHYLRRHRKTIRTLHSSRLSLSHQTTV